jgi:hypothetical protein
VVVVVVVVVTLAEQLCGRCGARAAGAGAHLMQVPSGVG